MNRIMSTIVVIVLLCTIISDLDARKLESSMNNNRKQFGKYRSKRQNDPFSTSSPNGACNFDTLNACQTYSSDINRSGASLQSAISTGQQHKFFLTGVVSLTALQHGGMCAPKSNLFTDNAFSALELGHITLPQLATLDLFPVQSIDTDKLLNAGYMNTFGQTNLLSALGMLASIFGHISPSQLQSLNLYPLQPSGTTAETLTQGGYLTNDCVPTALGLSAIHIHYLQANNLAEFGCQSGDNSQITLSQLSNAKYIYGRSNILTPVGLAALHTGFLSRDLYRQLNIFPFSTSIQTQSVDYPYQDQTRNNDVLNDLVHVGYLQANNYLITGVAYYAITKKYFTIEDFQNLNVWPYPGTPSMDMFISAGYASYSGHLTALGNSLLQAQYFPYDTLSKLGIHLHDEYHIFHHALRYGGFFRSDYHAIHASLYTITNPNIHTAQVSQDQSPSVDNTNTNDITN